MIERGDLEREGVVDDVIYFALTRRQKK